MEYGLPKTVDIGGEEFRIRYDFRAILDVFEALNDPELSDDCRALAVLVIFYPDCEQITDYQTALDRCFQFINGGEPPEKPKNQKPLVSWEKDFPYIIGPVNQSLGYEARAVPYDREANEGGVHWWTFLAAYMDIRDCLFSQIVGIRSKLAKGKPLDKSEKEFYRHNRDLIDIATKYTQAESAMLKKWGGK